MNCFRQPNAFYIAIRCEAIGDIMKFECGIPVGGDCNFLNCIGCWVELTELLHVTFYHYFTSYGIAQHGFIFEHTVHSTTFTPSDFQLQRLRFRIPYCRHVGEWRQPRDTVLRFFVIFLIFFSSALFLMKCR